MLRLENIVKKFNPDTIDEVDLFSNFHLEVEEGEFVSIVGSNGSGKTTLLNLVCGTIPVDGGNIYFNDLDITKMKEHKRATFTARVFQSPQKGSCGNLTILENMALADNKNKRFGLTPAISKKRINHYKSLLEETGMGLENRINTKAKTLSGGQRQALALVIANMSDNALLILDEHTAALDPKSSETIMQLTNKFVKEKKVTTLMVTHNLRFAVDYGNRLLMMHEGKVIKDIKGQEKENTTIDNLLDTFNEISIECGN